MKNALNSLKTVVARLQPIQRLALGAMLLVILAIAAYYNFSKPEITALLEKQKLLSTSQQALDVKKAQRTAILKMGAFHSTITTDQENRLTAAGNRIARAEEMQSLIGQIKDAVAKYGGKDFKFTQGATNRTVATLGTDRDSFIAHKTTIQVQFTGGFTAIEQVLFELKSMNRYMGIDKVELDSKGDSPAVHAQLTMNLYFVEREI